MLGEQADFTTYFEYVIIFHRHNMLVDAKSTILSYSPPTSKIWVTETLYNLNGDDPAITVHFIYFRLISVSYQGPVIGEDQAPQLVNSTYTYASNEGVQQIYW
jgi:hypothetical protein